MFDQNPTGILDKIHAAEKHISTNNVLKLDLESKNYGHTNFFKNNDLGEKHTIIRKLCREGRFKVVDATRER